MDSEEINKLRMLRHPLFVANPRKMRYNTFKTKHTDKFQFLGMIEMIILITGASHTGKTALAQKLLEKYKYPYLSIAI